MLFTPSDKMTVQAKCVTAAHACRRKRLTVSRCLFKQYSRFTLGFSSVCKNEKTKQLCMNFAGDEYKQRRDEELLKAHTVCTGGTAFKQEAIYLLNTPSG